MTRLLLIGLAVAVAIAGYLILTAPPSPSASRATETARVVRVIDGDTVILDDGRKVRYLGLDAPEISRTPFDPYGPEAFSLNHDLVQAKEVRLEYDTNKTDSYGRTLAFVYVQKGGRWICVNAALIREGLARTLFVPPNDRYKRYFRKLEDEAFRARRGMWSEVIDHPPLLTATQAADEFDKYQWQWVTVRLQVVDVYRSAAIVSLNSSLDHEGHFSAVIFTGDLDRFAKEGIDPATDYQGKTLEVTGYLKYYHGPEIIIQRTQQVSLLSEIVQTGSQKTASILYPLGARGVMPQKRLLPNG